MIFLKKILSFNKRQKSRGLQILVPKQIIWRLTIALAQVKANNTSENLRNAIHIFFVSIKRYKKSIQEYNEFSKVIKQNGYYFYEFWKFIITKQQK